MKKQAQVAAPAPGTGPAASGAASAKVKNTFLEFSVPEAHEDNSDKRRTRSDVQDARRSPLVVASKSPHCSPVLGPADPLQAVPIDEVTFKLLEESAEDDGGDVDLRANGGDGAAGELIAQANANLGRDEPAYVVPTTPSPFLHSAFPPSVVPPFAYGTGMYDLDSLDTGLPPAFGEGDVPMGAGGGPGGAAGGLEGFPEVDGQYMQGLGFLPEMFDGYGCGWPPPGTWGLQQALEANELAAAGAAGAGAAGSGGGGYMGGGRGDGQGASGMSRDIANGYGGGRQDDAGDDGRRDKRGGKNKKRGDDAVGGDRGGPGQSAVGTAVSALAAAHAGAGAGASGSGAAGRMDKGDNHQGEAGGGDQDLSAGNYTTVMLRNIPNKYTREMLIKQLSLEFGGMFDFMYLPIDFKNKCNVGYGFINFRTPEACEIFVSKFHGVDVRKCLPGLNSKKIVEVTPARVQGLSENVRRLRNSPVMSQLQDHPEWMPLLFNKDGIQEPFPMPDVPLPPVKPRGRNREARNYEG